MPTVNKIIIELDNKENTPMVEELVSLDEHWLDILEQQYYGLAS